MSSTILITGASGEIGGSLIEHFSKSTDNQIVALDLNEPAPELRSRCKAFIKGSIVDAAALKELESRFVFDKVFHLAGILSSGGEKNPALAHHVNVEGTFNLLTLARNHTVKRGAPVVFLFPSTLAIYGMGSLEEKRNAGCITEKQYEHAITMYGINKLYCERLGTYFAENYQLLGGGNEPKIDFRSIRLPGVISTDSVPTGGTSDYGPEMIHYAAQGKPYECFVRPDAQLPFMVMPDALQSLIKLADAPAHKLTQRVYNVTSFSVTADDIRAETLRRFPKAQISYKPTLERQRIVDSWPADISDSAARRDWGWQPAYDRRRAFDEYIIPNITKRYEKAKTSEHSCACA